MSPFSEGDTKELLIAFFMYQSCHSLPSTTSTQLRCRTSLPAVFSPGCLLLPLSCRIVPASAVRLVPAFDLPSQAYRSHTAALSPVLLPCAPRSIQSADIICEPAIRGTKEYYSTYPYGSGWDAAQGIHMDRVGGVRLVY